MQPGVHHNPCFDKSKHPAQSRRGQGGPAGSAPGLDALGRRRAAVCTRPAAAPWDGADTGRPRGIAHPCSPQFLLGRPRSPPHTPVPLSLQGSRGRPFPSLCASVSSWGQLSTKWALAQGCQKDGGGCVPLRVGGVVAPGAQVSLEHLGCPNF